MSPIDIVEILMWASFLIVFLFYACYMILLSYFNKRAGSHAKTLDYVYPTVSIVVPVYNEEKIIAKKIQNIEDLIYPNDKIEVVFVDGHSTDKTLEIIKDQARACRKLVKLIEQDKREGYTRGIIEGISNSRGEIILATDAASYYHQDAIKHLVKHFVDPGIGAVTGKEIVLGDGKELGPQLEKSYRFFYDFMRKAETEMDSTPDSKGEILAVRRDICNSLLVNLSSNASFDSCVPYQAKLMGYRTIYDEQAKYYEYAPASFTDRMRQQIRRATVLIGAMFLFRGMFLSKKYGKFGLVILPAHFTMCCVMPSIFMFGVVSFAIMTVIDPMKIILLWAIVMVAVIVSRKSRSVLISFIQSQFALVAAIFRLATRRESLFIESIPSTRVRE